MKILNIVWFQFCRKNMDVGIYEYYIYKYLVGIEDGRKYIKFKQKLIFVWWDDV